MNKMEQNNGEKDLTLDSYIKSVRDQEIKGILLKLKNEVRRDDVDQSIVDSLISSIKEKDAQTASVIEELLQKED